jgi:hypothetical protein
MHETTQSPLNGLNEMKLAAAEWARISIMSSRVYTEAESDALAKLVEVLNASYEDLPAEVASAYNQVLGVFRG